MTKRTSPIRYQTPFDGAFRPALKLAHDANARTVSRDNEPIPSECEDCPGFKSLTDDAARLRQEIKEKEIEFGYISRQQMVLLAMASHDLRLPLSTIRICTALLREGGTMVEHREFLDSIYLASEFMVRLLDDTLDLASSKEAGRAQLRPSPMLLQPVVAGSVSLNQPLARQKHMTLKLIEHGEPRNLLLDPVKISKVFNNLIENAIKFCPRGTRIEVRISHSADTVLVSVQDDGPGIERAVLENLFTPFQKTRAQALSDRPGAGLGLAIAKSIVDLHHGAIRAKSKVGEGTTFYVSLPLHIPETTERS